MGVRGRPRAPGVGKARVPDARPADEGGPMIKVFVTMQCPDCRAAVRELDERNVDYALVGVEELRHLKEFMNLRDAHPDAFAPVLGKGIGVPCFVRDDGLVTLDLAEALA